MAASNEVTAKFSVDISNLKKNIQEANRNIRLANAEFKAAAAGMDNWRTSSEGLSAKIGQLKSVLTSQKSVLESLKQQYEQVAAEQGANSKGAQELAIKIANQQAAVNQTTQDLNKYEKELGNVEKAEALAAKNGKTVEENLRDLGNEAKETGEKVEKSSEGYSVLKGAMANLVSQGILFAASAMKELAKETWESVKAAAAFADEINTLSAQTGLSTETLQEYKYMEDLIDVSTETMTGSMAKLIRNMANAQKGTGDAAAAFEALGISVTDANGELRSNQDVFNEAIDALGKMENETQRDAYAMQIFGRSAQDLNPLIEAGGEKIAALAQEAHDMGYVLDSEALDSLNETQDALDRLSKVAEGAKNSIVAGLGPVVSSVLEPLAGAVADLPAALKSGDFSGIFDTFRGVFEGAIQTAQDEGPAFIKAGINLVRQIAEGILGETPVMLETSALLLEAAMDGLSENLPQFIAFIPPLLQQLFAVLINQAPALLKAGNGLALALIKSIAGNLLPTILQGLPGFIKTIADAALESAPEFLQAGQDFLTAILEGIQTALPLLLEAIPQIIETIMGLLEQGLPLIISAAVVMFTGVVDALPQIVQMLIRNVPILITTATNILVQSLPLIIEAAVTMLKGIIQALPTIARLLVADLPMLVSVITQTLIANLPLIISAALELLFGICMAMNELVPELVKQAPELVKAIVKGIEESAGSMKEAGDNLVKGLWQGISGAKDWIKGKLTEWVGDVVGFVKDLFGVHSPSTVFEKEIGFQLPAGAALGVKKNTKALTSALRNMASEAVEATNLSPYVSGAKAAIGSAVYAGAPAAASGGNVTKVTNNTFNQYNTSPKALSRLEIYRQTNNQFNFAMGGA